MIKNKHKKAKQAKEQEFEHVNNNNNNANNVNNVNDMILYNATNNLSQSLSINVYVFFFLHNLSDYFLLWYI